MKPVHYIIGSLLVFAALSAMRAGQGAGSVLSKAEIARAIARAEGYFVPGSLPNVRNNPGSIFRGGVLATFRTPAEGWLALEELIERIANRSGPYRNAESWLDVAWMYVNGTKPDAAIIHASDAANGGPRQWLNNVLSALGRPEISPDSDFPLEVA